MLPFLLAAAAPAGASPPIDTGIHHVVLCWLNDPGNTAHRNQVIETSRELRAIPGIQDLAVGRPLASERPIVVDSFDVGVVMKFADRNALQAYLDHPEHVSRVRRILQPLCGRILVYDIEY